jgi:flavin-dependent dehydrogenase
LRRHFRLTPWGRLVEVHFAPGLECYVTPAGRERVGVALLWEPRAGEHPSFDALLGRFALVRAHLAGAAPDSVVRGAGPLYRRARAHVADRLLLVGDAAGYIDALSGEGLSLAFACALDLGPLLPRALACGATREALWPYEAIFARHFRRYAILTRALLLLAHRPMVRRAVVRRLAAHPHVFASALACAVG